MKREQYIKLSRAQARTVLSAEDYKKLRSAAKSKSYVSFKYTDREGTRAIYRAVRPKEFFFTPGWSGPEEKKKEAKTEEGEEVKEEEKEPEKPPAVYLWSFHLLHRRSHSFRADRIKDVNFFPTFIEALTDPQKYKIYWQGETAGVETTILSTGSLP